jgi:hypothetical protein
MLSIAFYSSMYSLYCPELGDTTILSFSFLICSSYQFSSFSIISSLFYRTIALLKSFKTFSIFLVIPSSKDP